MYILYSLDMHICICVYIYIYTYSRCRPDELLALPEPTLQGEELVVLSGGTTFKWGFLGAPCLFLAHQVPHQRKRTRRQGWKQAYHGRRDLPLKRLLAQATQLSHDMPQLLANALCRACGRNAGTATHAATRKPVLAHKVPPSTAGNQN